MSSWASQAHAFHQPVCQRLSLLHHWSVPHVHAIGVFSPSEWGPDPQCQAAQVAHWTWWLQCLAVCITDLSEHCPFISLQTLEVWLCQWPSIAGMEHKSCTHGHVFWKRGGMKRELVADPWTSSRRFHTLWLKVHSHLLLRACLLGSKRKLPPQACQVQPGLPSVVCHPRGVQFPHLQSGSFFKHLSPLHFLCTQCLQPLQKMLLLPTPVGQTTHGNLPELCRRSSPVPRIMIFVCPAFTLSPLFSIAFSMSRAWDMNTFFKRFSDDNKVISIEVSPGDLSLSREPQMWSLPNSCIQDGMLTGTPPSPPPLPMCREGHLLCSEHSLIYANGSILVCLHPAVFDIEFH